MVDIVKLGTALPPAIGKTLERIFLVPLGPNQHRVYLAFTDGTYYEFYGNGALSGGRSICRPAPR